MRMLASPVYLFVSSSHLQTRLQCKVSRPLFILADLDTYIIQYSYIKTGVFFFIVLKFAYYIFIDNFMRSFKIYNCSEALKMTSVREEK